MVVPFEGISRSIHELELYKGSLRGYIGFKVLGLKVQLGEPSYPK